MAVPDEPGGPPVIEVKVGSVEEAGRVLAESGKAVDAALSSVRRRAEDAIPAFPISDLQHAYTYAWGRWSQLLYDAGLRLAWAGTATDKAAQAYTDADRLPGHGNVPR